MCGRVHHNPIAFVGFVLLIITLPWDSTPPTLVLGFASRPPRPRACQLHTLPWLTLDCLQPNTPGRPQSCAIVSPDTDLQTTTTSTTTNIPPTRRQLDENARLDEPTPTGTVIYRTTVRPCTCHSSNYYDSYCPVGLNLCVSSSNSGWKCQPSNTRLGDLSRAVWPFACVMLILLASCLVGTSYGHQAILCRGNRWYAAYLLRRRPTAARRLIRQWVRRRRPALEARYRGLLQTDGNTAGARPRRLRRMEERMVQSAVDERRMRQPKRMLLPVRKYRKWNDQHRPNEASLSRIKVTVEDDEIKNDDDDDALLCDLGPTCTICYGPLNEGDRVGDLPCGHIFHSECLKVWLPRRNVCPLCLNGDIAKEERGMEPAPTITTSEEQFGSIADSIMSAGGPTGAAQIGSNSSEDGSATRRSVAESVDSGVLAHQEILNATDPPVVGSIRSDEAEALYANNTASVSDSDEPSGSESTI